MTDFLFSRTEPLDGSTIDVLQVGDYDSTRYGKFSITSQDLAAYVEEFRASNASGRRQVDFDHKGSQGDTRAAGWIKDLHVDGDKLKAEVEWTPAGRAAIEGKEYRFTSAEYTNKVRDKKTGETKPVKSMRAVTLTNRPFIDTMDPVSLSDDPDSRLAVLNISGDEPVAQVLSDALRDLAAEEILLATGTIGGKKISKLPKSSYAWTDGKGQSHLPYKTADGTIELSHTRNALARLNSVKGMSDDERTSVRRKLEAALRSAGGNPSGDNDNKTRKHMGEIHTLLKLSEDADETAMLDAVKELIESHKEPAEGSVSLSEFNAVKAAGEQTAQEFKDLQRDTYLSEMTRKGHITPAEIVEGSIVELYDAAPAAARKMIEARPVNSMLSEVGKGAGAETGETKLSEDAVYGAAGGRQALHTRTLSISKEQNISYGDAMILAEQEATA